jgi:hypothetical protein
VFLSPDSVCATLLGCEGTALPPHKMLIFFGNFAGVRQWWIGPLITLLPLLLNSGLLGAPLHLLSWLVRAAAAHAGRSAAGSCGTATSSANTS